ncbi:hypothetical protein BJ741DRAFT_588369 [Chytriomyces cf. hyalinus JEL632]|nr:hypothetical protein BJ741DRAFT_588369 [Chytriomyces cf. hyalinus JEL632]
MLHSGVSDSKDSAEALIRWLACSGADIANDFVACIIAQLQPGNEDSNAKRTKLAAALCLKCFLQELESAKIKVSLEICIHPLTAVVESDAIWHAPAARWMDTRLTSLCSALVLDILVHDTKIAADVAQSYLQSILRSMRRFSLEGSMHSVVVDASIECLEQAKSPSSLSLCVTSIVRTLQPETRTSSRSQLKKLISSISADPNALSFLEICGALSQRSEADLAYVLCDSPELESTLFTFVSNNIVNPSFPGASNLAYFLLSKLMTVSDPDGVRRIIYSLVSQLDQDFNLPHKEGDRLSNESSPLNVVARIFSDYLVRDAPFILHAVFSRLSSESILARRNSLFVISTILDTMHGLVQQQEGFDLRPTFEAAAGHLLERLSDEDVNLRSKSVGLFALLDPCFIIPRLCRVILECNSMNEKSSAEAALISVLCAAPSTTSNNAHEVFLEQIRTCALGYFSTNDLGGHNSIRSPGDLKKYSAVPTISAEESEKRVSRFISVATRWAQAMDPSYWKHVIPGLLEKSYSCAYDALPIRFLGAIIPCWGKSHDAIQCALDELFRLCRDQPLPSSEEDMVGESDLLFARLHPLLILKMLPVSFFDKTVTCQTDALSKELQSRIESSEEYGKVAMLSAEVFARLPTSLILPILCENLKPIHIKNNKKLVASYLYSSCHVVSAQTDHVRQFAGPLTVAILNALIFCQRQDMDDGIRRLSSGCIEYIAMCIQSSPPMPPKTAKNTPKLILEVYDSDVCSGDFEEQAIDFSTILHLVLRLLEAETIQPNDTNGKNVPSWIETASLEVRESLNQNDLNIPFATCMANILTTAFQRIQATNLKTSQQQEKIMSLMAAAWKPLTTAVHLTAGTTNVAQYHVYAAAALQTLFHIAIAVSSSSVLENDSVMRQYGASWAVFSRSAVDASLAGLQTSLQQSETVCLRVQSGCLKVLGALLVAGNCDTGVDGLTMLQVQRAMARCAESAESLAEVGDRFNHGHCECGWERAEGFAVRELALKIKSALS